MPSSVSGPFGQQCLAQLHFFKVILVLHPFFIFQMVMANGMNLATNLAQNSSTRAFRSALLNGSGGRNGQQKLQRRSQFFGESGPLPGERFGTTSFSRYPKTREEQEADLEDELKAEFVRVSMKNEPDQTIRFRKKTYTTMPRPFECYSCMSSSYQAKWAFLKEMYIAPKAFTDACDEPINRRSPIPTVLCASFCVSMLEPNVEAGVFVGFKYIRGCGDRILRHGFNQTALQIHRFAQVDKCRQLPRAHLFNQPRQLEVAITGNLQLCTCYGEHCNGSTSASRIANTSSILMIMITLVGWWILARWQWHILAF